jgi:3',5'-cyclic AMP phosphodiesterase CpdA
VPARLVHVSDLHAGGREEAEIEPALRELVTQLAPGLVVATGDLTHRGRPDQHDHAAAFLRSLGPPVLAVPGNHDIPLLPPARFTRTFAEFERVWETRAPVFTSEAFAVVGLCSVRPWRHQSGGLGDDQLELAARLLAEAPSGALRVVCLHHQLAGAPWRTRKRPVARRARVLARLAAAGAELILSGHTHQSQASERREFEVVEGGESAVAVVTAPGLGQPRPRRRGEPRGLHAIVPGDAEVRIATYAWSGTGWVLAAERRFPRGAGALLRRSP